MNDLQSSILITGATGFLGRNLAARMVRSGYDCVLTYRRSSNLDKIQPLIPFATLVNLDDFTVSQILREFQVRIIVHCATNFGRHSESNINALEPNLILPIKLLDGVARLKKRIGLFINTDTILDRRISQYTLAKKQFVEWLEHYSSLCACVNVRLEHFYGPCDDKSKFVTSMIGSMLRNVPFINLTPGLQKRSFIYIDDVVNALELIIGRHFNSKKGFLEYDVTHTVTTTVRECVELIRDITGNTITELRFGALRYRPNETMDLKVNLGTIRNLGWVPSVSLYDGLTRTIDAERMVYQESL